jgi:hypothetical protein
MTRRRTWTAALAAVVVMVTSAAACANGHGGTSTNASSAAIREQALKFSECMRANGVKDFPDPDASGELTIDAIANGSSVDTTSATFTRAMNACKNLEPPGFTGQKRTAQQQEAALAFAQCIRDKGVKDFPDPTVDGPLVDTNRIPSSATSNGMTILNAAMQTCGAMYAGQLGLTGK